MAAGSTAPEPELIPRENVDIFAEIKRLGWQFTARKSEDAGCWIGIMRTPQGSWSLAGSTFWVVIQGTMSMAAGMDIDCMGLEAIYGKRRTYLSADDYSVAPWPP